MKPPGFYTLKLLQRLPDLGATLIDLSLPMLERARQRVGTATRGTLHTIQGDIREVELGEAQFDIAVAAAVLHHLRDDAEWEAVFAKLHRCLRPGGSLWISDLVERSSGPIRQMMWARHGDYLTDLKDEAYRDTVYAYVAGEDTPRPLLYQVDLLRRVGFRSVDILRKNSVCAAFGATK